ncbi:multidrug resistance protein, MATE family [Chitinophaga costaii]|uniref:Multidrug-efflux transporter n=1 Tax=Chitinophaga costaii TaxID=1335309 RepID=A0A1C4BHQ1_9BACT|nr:MATE family efflux transporter [Chitinophaga costaii]PUZ27610.1 MATE family efflux transporter [Chitinophaga costaii]SCC06232.1 multidrug resistance protein, MATE family [Chitinophaga costaii]
MKNIFNIYKSHYKDNFHLAYPVIISQLGHTLVGLSDSVIIGHTGEVPLAAVSLGISIFTIFLVVGIGISYGLTPLVAQADGAGQQSACGYLLQHSLVINLLAGVMLCGGLLALSYNIGFLREPPAVAAQAATFLRLLGWSVLPLMFFQSFKQFTEGLGFTRQAMHITIVGNIINIVLGITLVYGFKMGVVGVGVATLADRVLMGIAMCYYVLRNKRFTPYLVGVRLHQFSRSIARQILSIGAPVALQYVFEVSAFSGAAIMVGWIGTPYLAAHQIAISLASMTFMGASGIAAAAGIKSGNFLGRGDYGELRRSAIASYHMVLVYMSCTAILFVVMRHILPTLYIRDVEVNGIAARLLLIAAFFQLFDGTQVVGLGILRGMGDVKVPTITTLFAYWGFALPVGYMLGIKMGWGISGIWWGLLLGLLASSVMVFIRFHIRTRQMVAANG